MLRETLHEHSLQRGECLVATSQRSAPGYLPLARHQRKGWRPPFGLRGGVCADTLGGGQKGLDHGYQTGYRAVISERRMLRGREQSSTAQLFGGNLGGNTDNLAWVTTSARCGTRRLPEPLSLRTRLRTACLIERSRAHHVRVQFDGSGWLVRIPARKIA